ncbi:MAG: hypothetical protein EOP04_02135 [Proteobacteria bacterium]|nr:MAG: hypothetical protein EOP04_02135 [Pseudomonadota bacterium]
MTNGPTRSFSFKTESEGKISKIYVSGFLDAHFSWENAASSITSKSILVNLKDAQDLNSTGIRQWIFSAKIFENLDVTLSEVSDGLVTLFNQVPRMVENFRIQSFYVPLACYNEHEVDRLVKTSILNGETIAAIPNEKCIVCNADLELATPERDHLEFLKYCRTSL